MAERRPREISWLGIGTTRRALKPHGLQRRVKRPFVAVKRPGVIEALGERLIFDLVRAADG
jgi:hypothetical protein